MTQNWWNRPMGAAEAEETPLTWDHTWPFNPDSPVIEGIARQDRALSIMLVDLTGLDWAEIEPMLSTAREVAAAREMLPILIVDLTDFSELRHAGFAYDALPNAAANAPMHPKLDWAAYLARRRKLLMAKWQPAAIVRLSDHAEGWE